MVVNTSSDPHHLLRRRSSDRPWIIASMILQLGLFVVVCLALVTDAQPQTPPYAVEPLMNNLNFYGPIYPDSSWGPHPMALVADYTWQINVTLEVGNFFLLVNMNNGVPDWKTCKLGRGLSSDSLEIGGGNIPVPARGDYTLTYFTPSLASSTRTPIYPNAMPSGFIMAGRNLWPAAYLNSTQFVTANDAITMNLYFSADVDGDMVLSNFSQITFSNAVANVGDFVQTSNTSFSFTITPNLVDRTKALIWITIPESLSRAINSIDNNRPTTGVSWSLIYSPPAWRSGVGSWERLTLLRDQGDRWPVGKPDGGWWVTAIHGNMIAKSGHVVLTGWGRSQEFACTSNGARKQGVSFILNPDDITNLPAPTPQAPNFTLAVDTIDEAPRLPIDVLYCSGHAPLRDGRKLYAGGAFYANLSTDAEKETGIPYARMFDPLTNNFTRIEPDMPIGTAWYPTNSRLPDGRVLISGGFLAFTCYGSATCYNPALTIFNVTAYDAGENPWVWYLPANQSDHRIDPGGKDYTRIWQLLRPIFVDGWWRTVAMMGYQGITLLVSLDPETPDDTRFYTPPNGLRPNGGMAGCNADSTSTIVSTGELLSMGGCGSSWIDLYNPDTDSWKSIDTGIPRNTGSSLLLPTGKVLLINGENGRVDQSATLNLFQTPTGDPRYPQFFDPVTFTIETFLEQEDGGENNFAPFRGYHNAITLLKDARILVSGGVHQRGDIGCEQPNIRIYNPPYLRPLTGSALRPLWDGEMMLSLNISNIDPLTGQSTPQFTNNSIEPFFLRLNSTITISFTQGPLRTTNFLNSTYGSGGVVLMAIQAFTHAYDQNQRYIPLEFVDAESNATAGLTEGTVTLAIPSSPLLIPGEYFLFLISANDVPSVALQTRVLASDEVFETAYLYPAFPGGAIPLPPSPGGDPYDPTIGGNDEGIWSKQNIILIGVLGGAGVLFFAVLAIWFVRKQKQEDRRANTSTDTQLAPSAGRQSFDPLD